MLISVTSLRLRRLWLFFSFSWMAFQVVKQTRSAPGCRSLRTRGFGREHFTISVWDSEAQMRQFAGSGAHREAMRKTASVADEVRICTYEADTPPSWAEARQLLQTRGRVLRY